jgi:Polysaccharide lyase family 4, domain II
MRKFAAAAIFFAASVIGADARGYEAVNVINGGTITGVVKIDGPAPKRALLEVSKDRDVCATHPLYDDSLIASKSGGIKNAVVTISDISKGKPFTPASHVKFDQRGCEYVPHVAAFPAGSTVEIINSDGILHSVHTESTVNPVIDMAQPGFKKMIPETIAKPEAIKVTCDAHNWMVGWWYVTANPYYAVTGDSGHFTIGNVPAGTYTVQVWQEKIGIKTQKVTVKPGATTTVEFALKAK